MRQREARGNKKRPTSDRLSAVNEFFRHKRPGNRPEDAARCKWRDGRHRRTSRSRIRGKLVFFGCCGLWGGSRRGPVKAGLSTADMATTPLNAEAMRRRAGFNGRPGSAQRDARGIFPPLLTVKNFIIIIIDVKLHSQKTKQARCPDPASRKGQK